MGGFLSKILFFLVLSIATMQGGAQYLNKWSKDIQHWIFHDLARGKAAKLTPVVRRVPLQEIYQRKKEKRRQYWVKTGRFDKLLAESIDEIRKIQRTLKK